MPNSSVLPETPRRGASAHAAEGIFAAAVFGAQRFLNEPLWDDLLPEWLGRLGNAAGADQERVFRNDDDSPADDPSASLWREWRAPGAPGSPVEAFQHASYRGVGCERWIGLLRAGNTIAGNVGTLPQSERAIMAHEGVRSMVIVPVFAGGAWWGFMGFADCVDERHWAEAEVEGLQAAAGILGAALGRRELEARIATAAMQQQLGEEIGDIVTKSAAGLDEMLRIASERIAHHFGADLVRVWAIERDGRTLRSPSGTSFLLDDSETVTLEVGTAAVGRIAKTRRPEVWRSGLPETWPGCDARYAGAGLVSGAGYPLVIDDRVAGVIVVLNREPLSAAMLASLSSITDELALAIEHSRARSALHLSEDRYRRLVEATVEGICIHDGVRVHDYNPSLARMLLLDPADPRELNPIDFIHPDDRPVAIHNIATDHTDEYEVRMLRTDGTSFPAAVKGRNYEYDGMRLRVTSVSDLTQRKAALVTEIRLEEESRAREAAERDRVRALILSDASRILASSFDTTTTLTQLARLVTASLAEWCIVSLEKEPGQERVLAITPESPRYRVLAETLDRWVEQDASDSLVQRQRAGVPFISTHGDPTADEAFRAGLELCCRSLMSVPIASGGVLLGSILVGADADRPPFDERQLALAEELGRRAAVALLSARSYHDALAATVARDEMLAVVAHDLRNPLNTIYMSSSLALDMAGDPESPEVKQFEIIRRSSEHMNRLIQDLLDATCMQSGQLALDPAPVEAAQIVSEAAELLEPLARNAGIAFVTRLDQDVPLLAVDRSRVLQVLSNLIGNAIKFTPRGGGVTLSVHADAAGGRFVVRDSGPGIAPDQLPHIFGRFWQARRTDRRGLGLGLAIAKGIVEAHGGAIWVESTLGVGSGFLFTVPAARA